MATKDYNLIPVSYNDILTKLNAVAQKVGLDTGETDFDWLTSSAMEYITESQAMILRDSALHKMALYNESFLNTAVMPSSIYNHAKTYNIEITKATPAYADITLTIEQTALDNAIAIAKNTNSKFTKYGTDVTALSSDGINVFVIDKSNNIIAGDYNFSLEHSIIIYKDSNGSYVIKYCLTEDNATTAFTTVTNKYIPSTRSITDGYYYLSFTVRTYQYYSKKYSKQITSSSIVDSKIHTFEYDGQICGMKLVYTKNDKDENIDIRFSNMDNSTSTGKYCFYDIVSDGKIKIKFTSKSFIPSVGSTIALTLFLTDGASGTITYTDSAIFALKDDTYKNVSLTATFKDQASYNGADAPSLSDIKSMIVKELSTRKAIITESDLNEYFLKLTLALEDVQRGKIKFVKKRDDIIKRTFIAYVLLRDGLYRNGMVAPSDYSSNVIPTNTIDVQYNITNTTSTLPFAQLVNYDSDNNVYLTSSDTGVDDSYIIPFVSRIILNPIKKVKYMYNLADDSSTLNYLNVNNLSGYTLEPVSCKVTRNLDGLNVSGYYVFDFQFTGDFNLQNELSVNSVITFNLYSSNTISNSCVVTYNTTGVLSTSHPICTCTSVEDDGLFTSNVRVIVPVASEEFDFGSSDSSDYGTTIKLKFGDSTTLGFPEDVKTGLKLVLNSTKAVNVSYKSDDYLTIFRNLDDIMSSDIILNTTTTEGVTTLNYITIKDVPVIHKSYFNRTLTTTEGVTTAYSNMSKFIKLLFIYIDMLKNNVSKLETNTFFDLKFFNTYGTSYLYNTTSTNLDLEMTIWLKNSASLLSNIDDIKEDIRDYVRTIVDDSNDDNSLRISSLITIVVKSYSDYIDHIDFEGLNGTYRQFVTDANATDANIQNYPSEYFSLDYNTLDNIKFEFID